jgi:hydrogenase nickel incorporation protein HypA/HybF
VHEYSIIQSLVDSVEAAVGARANATVHAVEVSIGELAGVDCELLATAYDVFREGTLCEHAPLTIDRIPARWECSRCGATLERGSRLRCALCDEEPRLASGDEIILKRIELEVA